LRYLGGKTRNAKWIAQEIAFRRKPNQTYIEPFCGGLSVSVAVNSGSMQLYDIHPGLINLYRGLKDGTFAISEKRCTQEEYKAISLNPDHTDPYHTMVGFGLSYAGKWWGGYDTYYDNREQVGKTWTMLVNSLTKKMKSLPADIVFGCSDYRDLNPQDTIIYADPPYADATKYEFIKGFGYTEFWDVMREWSKNNTVLVSEYAAPDDFVCVRQAYYKVQMCRKQQNRTEKLFTLL